MVFYLIGLGLGDAEDITVKGLNAIRKCVRCYLESYTSQLVQSDKQQKEYLEQFYGKQLLLADRTFVEQNSDELLKGADENDVCLLVVGDPFAATTHTDIVLRAQELNIDVKVIHNASIMNAVGCCGLQLYKFGATVSIVFWDEHCQPDSYYDKIASNREQGLHTLCLLDIRVKEQSFENLMRGIEKYEPARYMSCAQAAAQLLEIVERRQEKEPLLKPAYSSSTECVGLARVGCDDQKIVYCSLEQMRLVDMGEPLHSLIIPGNMDHMELKMLQKFRWM